jgi:hypothetical protein
MSAWRRCVRGVGGFLLLMGLAGCATIDGGPERLYTVKDEVAQAQAELPFLLQQYNSVTNFGSAQADATRMYYRNEYIARRMYVIDVEYSAYEAALTSERQKWGFGADLAGEALTTVASLSTPGLTARALSGAAGAVNATTGFYDKDLIIAKTIQIVEADMRAQRDTVANNILIRRSESSLTYPIAAAMSDLEDYYRAGTFNTGLIEASGDAANNATIAASNKTILVTYGSNASTITLQACLNKAGAEAKLVALMSPSSHAALVALAYDTSPVGESARAALLAKAKVQGICP